MNGRTCYLRKTSYINRTREKCKKLLLLALVIFLLFLFSLPACFVQADAASAEGKGEAELGESVEELISALDTQELQEYLNTLSGFENVTLKDKLLSVITGDFALDYDSIWQACVALVWEEGRIMLPAFAVILAVALLVGILNSVKNGF